MFRPILWLIAATTALACAAPTALAMLAPAHQAEASHEGWPEITGLNVRASGSETIDARPGHGRVVAAPGDPLCPTSRGGRGRGRESGRCLAPIGHNELLGANGDDTIYAGSEGDVIWGDYLPSGQPESQHDELHGGAGNDWIYSSHGFNHIWTGAGNDHIQLVYGHGTVTCNGGGLKTFVMRYLPQNRPWKLEGCNHKVISRYRA